MALVNLLSQLAFSAAQEGQNVPRSKTHRPFEEKNHKDLLVLNMCYSQNSEHLDIFSRLLTTVLFLQLDVEQWARSELT